MPNIDKHRIQINGAQVPFQGFAKLRDSVSAEKAAEKTKENGLDEYIIEYENGKGETERAVVWGDQLDFKFRKRHDQPDVTVDGKPARILAHDDEATTIGEGAKRGVIEGYRSAFDSVGDLGKRIIGSVAIGAGATFVGGTVYTVATKGTATAIGAAASAVGVPVAYGAAIVAGAAVVLVGVAGTAKGALAAKENRPKMETIAGIIEESGQRERPVHRDDDEDHKPGDVHPRD